MEDIRIMSFIEKYARITPDAPAIMDADRHVINYSRGSHSSVFYEENAENIREVLENILTDIS